MNTRQVATGTVLTASLLLGGSGLADARPNTGAMDRGTVPSCQRIENRLDAIQDNLARLEARLVRLQDRLADAKADGAHRRIRVLQAHIARTQRALQNLEARQDHLLAQHEAYCEEPQAQ